MSCCRGRALRRSPGTQDPPDCKSLEQSGARTTLWPIATNQGMHLVIKTQRSGMVEFGSYLQMFRCNGATAIMAKRYLDSLRRAAANSPASFAPFSRTGITLAEAIGIADKVARNDAVPSNKSVH